MNISSEKLEGLPITYITESRCYDMIHGGLPQLSAHLYPEDVRLLDGEVFATKTARYCIGEQS